MDSVLLGASVPQSARLLLDLGAGAGVAGLSALAHNRGLSAVLVETDPEAARLAWDNIAHNGFSGRAQVIAVSATARGAERKAAGLGTDRFDVAIANPPFFEAGTRAPDAGRAAARHAEGEIGDWVRTAVSAAHSGGEVIFIHLARALPALLDAFAARMGEITVLPIAPRPGQEASRVLVRGRKGSKAPLRLLSPLVLHGETGNGFSARAEAIFRGETVLDWR